MRIRICAFIAVLLLGVGVVTMSGRADTFQVTVNTSSLIDNPAGPYEVGFLLIDASGEGDGNNTATISSFTYGGGSPGSVDAAGTMGGATGSLNSGIMLTDTSFFNGLSSTFTPGTTFSFDVNMSTNLDANTSATGLSGDQFDFFIFDNTLLPIQTTDPTGGDTLAVATITSNGLSVQNYSIQTPTSVTEPATVLLLGCGIIGLWLMRRVLAVHESTF